MTSTSTLEFGGIWLGPATYVTSRFSVVSGIVVLLPQFQLVSQSFIIIYIVGLLQGHIKIRVRNFIV